jgi:caa(3)-type oxidase subunit IV
MSIEEHTHPPYMKIWGVLAVMMLGKVLVGLSNLPKSLAVGLLVLISFSSAALVALYYMHLRFETKKLWLLALLPFPLVAILIVTVIQEW